MPVAEELPDSEMFDALAGFGTRRVRACVLSRLDLVDDSAAGSPSTCSMPGTALSPGQAPHGGLLADAWRITRSGPRPAN